MNEDKPEAVGITELRSRLHEVLDRVEAGQTIQILRRGQPVALLTPVQTPKRPVDVDMLRRVAAKMPFQTESAGDLIRRMRDEGRY